MPPTLPPHLLPGPGRVLLLPGPGSPEWRQWSAELRKSDPGVCLRCVDLWTVALRRAEAAVVFLLLGLGAAIAAVLRSRLHAGLTVLFIALAVLGAALLALGLARVIAQRAYDAATDSAAAAAAEFRPDVLVGSGAGGLVALRLRDRGGSCVVVSPLHAWWRLLLGLAQPHGIDAIARALEGTDPESPDSPRLLAAARVPVSLVEKAPASGAELRALLGVVDQVRDSESEDGMLTASSRGASAFDDTRSQASV